MEKTVTATLKLRIDDYMAKLAVAKAGSAEFAKNLGGIGKTAGANTDQLAKQAKAQEAVGHASLLMAAGMAAGLGLAAKAAIDWESSWAGVEKAVAGSKSQMAQLEGGLRSLATTLPASHTQIAAVAASAGQLGIAREGIVQFTKTMLDLGATTDLSADDAATGIAKIMNVMQTPVSEVGRLGSALSALGNYGASTEGEILSMASRIAGAGKLVGASEADVLGLANALTSMGIQAELGGGSVSRIMLKIYSAVKSGGSALQGFADVAGVSAKEFAAKFGSQPIQAIDDLVKGLGRIDKSGGNVIATLGDLGFKGVRDLQVLLKLKGSGDLLSQSLEVGSKAWEENTALTERAQKRYETTASQLKVLGNQAVDLGIKFGGVLLPSIKGATSGLNILVSGIAAMPSAARDAGIGIATISTGLLGVIGLVGTFAPKISKLVSALNEMGSIGQLVAGNLGLIAGGLGIAAAAFAVYSYILGQHAKAQAEAKTRIDALSAAITQQGTATGQTTDELNLNAVMVGDVGVALRKSHTDLTVFVDAMNTGGIAGQKLRSDLSDLEQGLRLGYGLPNFIALLKEGRLAGSPLQSVLMGLAKSGDISAPAMARLVARLREQNDALNQGQVAVTNKAAADQGAAQAANATENATQRAAAALKAQAAAATAATAEMKDLNDAEHAALDPLFGMVDALKANADAQAAVNTAEHDGKSSAEDINAAHLAAAKSALDLDVAATNLAGSIKAGIVPLQDAKLQLKEWVANGLISQATANTMAAQFDFAAAAADKIAGDRTADLNAVDHASPVIAHVLDLLSQFDAFNGTVVGVALHIAKTGDTSIPDAIKQVTTPGGAPKTGAKGQAAGGWAGTGATLNAASGSDNIRTYLGKGEFVVDAHAAGRNAAALEQLNRTGSLPAGATASARFGTPATSSSSVVGGTAVIEHHHHTEVRLLLDGKDVTKSTRKTVRKAGGNTKTFGRV